MLHATRGSRRRCSGSLGTSDEGQEAEDVEDEVEEEHGDDVDGEARGGETVALQHLAAVGRTGQQRARVAADAGDVGPLDAGQGLVGVEEPRQVLGPDGVLGQRVQTDEDAAGDEQQVVERDEEADGQRHRLEGRREGRAAGRRRVARHRQHGQRQQERRPVRSQAHQTVRHRHERHRLHQEAGQLFRFIVPSVNRVDTKRNRGEKRKKERKKRDAPGPRLWRRSRPSVRRVRRGPRARRRATRRGRRPARRTAPGTCSPSSARTGRPGRSRRCAVRARPGRRCSTGRPAARSPWNSFHAFHLQVC